MPQPTRKLLITGISGFLGWNLIREASENWLVTGITHSHDLPVSGLSTHRLDLGDFEALKDVVHRVTPDAVIHAAAVTDPNVCQQYPDASRRLNVTASANLAGLCADHKIPLVFTSTDLVFDGTRAPYAETAPVSPLSVYGEQKVAAEIEILRRHPDATICRLPLMFGDSGPVAKSFLQPLLQRLQAGEPLSLFTDEFRTPASGTAAARGLLMALEFSPGVLHLGGGERISRYDFGHLVARTFGLNHAAITACRQRDLRLAAPRPADVSLDSRKAHRLGFAPRSLLEELIGLRESRSSPSAQRRA